MERMSALTTENIGLDIKPFLFEPYDLYLVKEFAPPGSEDLAGQPSFKYLDFELAKSVSTKYVKEILNSVPLSGKHKYVVVDVKVVDLKKGQYPCNPGWHTDCTLDPYHKTLPEIHHILKKFRSLLRNRIRKFFLFQKTVFLGITVLIYMLHHQQERLGKEFLSE
jgi:hypothetical protein